MVTVGTSLAASQLRITPSASRPAKANMPSRSAAMWIGTGSLGTTPRRNPLMLVPLTSALTLSPVSDARRKRTMSRTW